MQRACKTLADERVVINKESAAIRTSFKEEDAYARHSNIERLLYIYMLGYPAHFGQVECLKLVASPKFADKRLGYLGIMLLLDESAELLTMVTNSLKNDMNHSNQYIVGLALCTFANIASEEMSRDLVNEVEKLLGSSNVYIRKKAALCAMRIIRRVPDLVDHFVERAISLLSDRNHGVLLCGVTLVVEMCAVDGQVVDGFRKAVPLLVRHLKALVTTGYSPEHDVTGITDPFLQVKLLRLMRIVGRGDVEASEAMNDILAQVATNTDTSKNVGNAILYEAVITILEIEAEESLRVLAINNLGKFLSNKDNNIRYVALNTLNKVVGLDTNAVQRHRAIILDCLRDGDVSIRRRALELTYALINESNVRVLIRELLAFLEVADPEFKVGMTTQICLAAEKFAPNKRWHIDTVLRVLKLAGTAVREEVLSGFIRLICHTPELQGYTVQKLYGSLKSDLSQESLTLVGVWSIGEFGDILLSAGGMDDGELSYDITEHDIIQLFQAILASPYTNITIRQYILTASTKLSARFSNQSPEQAHLLDLMKPFESSIELEAQQRSVEFCQLLTTVDEATRLGVLERMPLPEIKATVLGTVSERRAVGSTKAGKDTLLDLTSDDSEVSSKGPATKQGPTTQDLLADLFGSNDSAPVPTQPTPATKSSGVDDILGLFESQSAPSAAPQPRPPPPVYDAFEKHGLKLTFTSQRDPKNPLVHNITATFSATEGAISDINFQVAVPKTQKLQMSALSQASIAPGELATQQLRVMAPENVGVRLRLRMGFTAAGVAQQEQTDFAFPVL